MTDTVDITRRIPVVRDVDVVVAGCGISGLFAALGAARQGATVLAVDRMAAPGGNIGPGMIGGYGIGREIKSHLHNGEYPGAIADFMRRLNRHLADIPWIYATMSHAASRVALEMFEEHGVQLMLSAYASDPIMDGSRVTGLLVETKSGTVAVRAKVVVDATGDADVAIRAGAPVRKRVPAEEIYRPDQINQPTKRFICSNPSATSWNDGQVYFYVGEADLWKYIAFCREPCQLSDGEKEWADRNLICWSPWAAPMVPILKQGWESGEYRVEREIRPNVRAALNDWFSISMARPGHVGGRAGIFGDYDTANWEDVTMMEREVRNVVYDGIAFFRRRRVPGFENAYLLGISPFLGARGGPFINGEYTVTIKHLAEGNRMPDVMYTTDAAWPQPTDGYDMPYRMLLPKEVDGLLVCGRGAAFVRRGHDPGTRERSNMMALGHAAGIAAALCSRDGVTPRMLNISALQRVLLESGFHLGDERRLAELGLG